MKTPWSTKDEQPVKSHYAKPMQSRSINPLTLGAIGAVFVVAVAVVAMALLLQSASEPWQLRQQNAESAMVKRLAENLASRLHAYERQVDIVANHPQTQLLVSSSAGMTVELSQWLKPFFPDAIRITVLPPGFSEPDRETSPPLGFAVVELVQRSAESKKPQPMEIHFPGTPDEHANFLHPVLDENQNIAGYLLVSYASDLFKSALQNVDANGGLIGVLYKPAGADGFDLAATGDSSLRASESLIQEPVKGLPLTIFYVSPRGSQAAGGLFADLDSLRLGLIVGGSVLLMLAAVLLPIFLVVSNLKKDGATLVRIIEDIKRGQTRLEYPAAISQLQESMRHMVDVAREIDLQLATDPEARGLAAGNASRNGGRSGEDMESELDDFNAQEDVYLGDLAGLEVVEEFDAESDGEDAIAAKAAFAIDESADFEDVVPDIKKSPANSDKVKLDPTIFRAYDIRGIVDESLTPGFARLLGMAIGTAAEARGQKAVVVGRDGRLSGPELTNALIEGLTSVGRQVINIGQVPTPVMYYATVHLGTGTGVSVTGSHNPPNYNGFKIMIGGETLSGEAIQGLKKIIESGEFAKGEGQAREQDVRQAYMDRIVEDVTLHRPLKIVVDCGNGVAGDIAPALFEMIGCDVEPLFCEVDGYFPHHHPDPSEPKNLEAMISLVRLQGADLGLAFDGDGDRLGVVDCKGNIIWPDRQMMLFARDVLSRNPGAEIIYDVKCTNQLAQVIRENGGVPLMWKTGHSLVKAKLKESGAPLAGEMSGHIFFSERWYGFDDGLYTAARLLEIVSADPRSSLEIFAELPNSVNTPEIKVNMAEGEPPKFIETFTKVAQLPEATISTIDGVRADFADGWGLVRASNTTPCLVCRFDAVDESALERIKTLFREQMLAVKPDLNLPF